MEDPGEILRRHLANIKNKIAERMATSGRNASGRSVASLSVQIDGDHAILWGSKSFLSMEKGRGPGAVPMGFTEIIMAWARAKGISVRAKVPQSGSQDAVLRSFAGAVAYNIMKKGTKLYRSKQHDDIFTSVVAEELKQMSDDMAINILDQITRINDSAQ